MVGSTSPPETLSRWVRMRSVRQYLARSRPPPGSRATHTVASSMVVLGVSGRGSDCPRVGRRSTPTAALCHEECLNHGVSLDLAALEPINSVLINSRPVQRVRGPSSASCTASRACWARTAELGSGGHSPHRRGPLAKAGCREVRRSSRWPETLTPTSVRSDMSSPDGIEGDRPKEDCSARTQGQHLCIVDLAGQPRAGRGPTLVLTSGAIRNDCVMIFTFGFLLSANEDRLGPLIDHTWDQKSEARPGRLNRGRQG